MTRRGRLSQRWADLSLRTKLLLFAVCVVTVPGVAFALFAFAGARAALEREVGIQLQQTAERGADTVAAAFDRARSDTASWAGQDVMRDLLVGDLDKRVSRFLRTMRDNEAAYLEVLAVDGAGTVVAASSGDWIGRTLHWPALDGGEEAPAVVGPLRSPEFGREVVQIAAPIANPDPPGGRIGTLLLVYDWSAVGSRLDAIRLKLAQLGKRVAALIVDPGGRVIGGVGFDGQPAHDTALAREPWGELAPNGYTTRAVHRSSAVPGGVLVGASVIPRPTLGWSVLLVERSEEALAPVRTIRTRWIVVMTVILLLGLAVAAWLADQFMRPLSHVTRATADIAARPDLELPLLPVDSRNEVGQLTDSFNRMTTALRRSQDEALSAAKFAFAGELAAMVAHEVRTPLSVMRSSAQMLASPAATAAADSAELVDTIVAEVDRVERVVTGLIQLARPVEQHLQPSCLSDVLARAADFADAQARRQRIQIERDFSAAAPPALCDGEQIYQVVLNLVVNALQALPPGGSIRLRTLAPEAGMVGFEVADDGPGLPAAIRERIFEPFVTGRDGGTGLGLAFVDRIVKGHRGRVTVRSDEGRGTVFDVRLPQADGAR